MSKADRKRLAAALYSEHNYTQQQIADVLGVDRTTITRDLDDLFTCTNRKRKDLIDIIPGE